MWQWIVVRDFSMYSFLINMDKSGTGCYTHARMHTHKVVHIHRFSCSVRWEGLKTTRLQLQQACVVQESRLLTQYHSPGKPKYNSRRKSRIHHFFKGPGNLQDENEDIVVLENKILFKQLRGLLTGKSEPPNSAPKGWDNLSNKIKLY
jgi:hypothetical protein